MNSSASISSPSSGPFHNWINLALVVSRFFVTLSLSLWIGGMAFFGIMAAPVLFHPEKSGIARTPNTAIMAPQMVSAMLTRFGTLTTICGILLLLGWLIDGLLSRSVRTRSWRLQGALTLLCVVISQYLNVALLPRTRAEQSNILPIIARADQGETLSAAERARRAEFDAGHKSYQRLASLNLYLLMAVLLILLSRSLHSRPDAPENGKLGRE
jgi:hypothetical protein